MANIFSKAAKGASDLLAIVRASRAPEKVITCAADTVPQPDKNGIMQGGLPWGFFLLKSSDKTLLCYHDRASGQQWRGVTDSFINPLTKQVIKLDVPRATLQVFRLNLRQTMADGMARIGSYLVMDTENQPRQWDGEAEYFRDDNSRHEPLKDDLSNGLWR